MASDKTCVVCKRNVLTAADATDIVGLAWAMWRESVFLRDWV